VVTLLILSMVLATSALLDNIMTSDKPSVNHALQAQAAAIIKTELLLFAVAQLDTL